MAVIRCPNCGKPNPDFIEACQYCDTKLRPEGAAPAGTPPVPTASAEDTLISKPAAPAPPAAPDENTEPEGEPLDWMNRLRRMQSGEAPPAARASSGEPDGMWTGRLSEERAKAPSAATQPEPTAAAPDSSVELPEWLRDLDEPAAESPAPKPREPSLPPPATRAFSRTPGSDAPQSSPPESDKPTRDTPAAASAPVALPAVTPGDRSPNIGTPTIGAPPAAPEPSPFEPSASDVTIPPRPRRTLTDWLDKLKEMPPAAPAPEPEAPAIPNTDADLPNWLKTINIESAAAGNLAPAIEAATTPPAGAPPATPIAAETPEDELPDWLHALRAKSDEAKLVPGTAALQSQPPARTGSLPATRRVQALPESLRSQAPDDTLAPAPGGGAPTPEPASDDLPEWLRGILSTQAQDAAPPAPDTQAAVPGATAAVAPASAAAVATTPAATPDTAVTAATQSASPSMPPAEATFPVQAQGAPQTVEQDMVLPGVQPSTAPSAAAPAADETMAPPTRRPKRMIDWIGSVPAPSASTPSAATPEPASDELPDWLKSLSAQNAAASIAIAATAPSAEQLTAQQPAALAEDLPDWPTALAAQAEATTAATPITPALELAASTVPPPSTRAAEQLAAEPVVAPVEPAAPPETPGTAMPATPAEEEKLPAWLKAITQAQPTVPATAGAASEAPALAAASQAAAMDASSTATPTAAADIAGDLPDWLKAIQAQAATAATPDTVYAAGLADTPKSEPALQAPPVAAHEAPAPKEDLPDWLKAITQVQDTAPASTAAETLTPTPAASVAATAAQAADVTATVVSAGATAPAAEPARQPPTAPAAPVELPPWLKGVGTAPVPDLPELDEETLAWLNQNQKTAPVPAGLDLSAAKLPAEQPAWLNELAAVSPASGPAAAAAVAPEITPTPAADLPEWLRAMRGQSAEEEGSPEAMPDWLRGLPPGAARPAGAAEAAGTAQPTGAAQPSRAAQPAGAATVPAPTTAAATPAAPAAPAGLEQAALPAWLAAMRPVDIAQPVATEADSYQETLGVLAGMRGVLRAEPVVAQPHKATTAVHILAVSDTNTAQANLLTELLRAETAVQPARRGRVRLSALVERWVIFALLAAAILFTQFNSRGLFAPPPALPAEGQAVFDAVETAGKLGKPALVAFDYDAAQQGELDPGAAAVIGHLARRGVPIVAVSLRLTGPAVAEQLLTKTASSGYVNLGFIPGGSVGLLQFAADPRSMFKTDFGGSTTVWQTGVLSNVHQLSDFGLIVLVSGTPESTRAWIEQAQSFASGVPTVAVISAGAEAMLRPYYDDANAAFKGLMPLKGLVVGLGGAAAYERATNSPGAATALWPALGGGLLGAAVLIAAGNLFFAVWGALRRRRS